VTLGRGRTRHYLRVLGSAALAAGAVLAAAGCSQAAAPASADSGSSHALTFAGAQAAYNAYVGISTQSAAQGNEVRILALTADEQWSYLHAQYAALAAAGTPVPTYSYGRPVFYVPALAGYPYWFLVAVPVRTDTNGRLGPAVNTLMLFQRSSAAGIWTLNGTAVLNQPLPAIARDREGYAINVTNVDPDLLLPPYLVGATQAAVVDEGSANPASAVIASGPLTTGLYATQTAQAKSITAQGLTYEFLLQSASYAEYQMQTANGGALVLYAMYLNTQTEHHGDLAGSPVRVPADIRPLLTNPNAVGVHGVVANFTFEYAAIDPPSTIHGAKVDVIAGGGGPTYGHAY
jgi:hypothetical protein